LFKAVNEVRADAEVVLIQILMQLQGGGRNAMGGARRAEMDDLRCEPLRFQSNLASIIINYQLDFSQKEV
jgi:hypothetical protein